MICWPRAIRWKTTPTTYLVPIGIPHVLFLVVPVDKLNSTLVTMNILVHLKQLMVKMHHFVQTSLARRLQFSQSW